jgi:acetyl esterase/lipase
VFTDSLRADIYEPVGDTMAARATVILLHTGSFIPIFYNGQATGARTDSALREMCQQFARRGYTAISIDYRMGWNPQALGAAGQEIRTGTLLQAAGRGIQDARAAIRFFRNNALNGGNTWKIDESQIILGGLGTGGYLALGAATIDNNADVSLLKFTASQPNATYGFTPGVSYFDSTLWGNTFGYGGQPVLNNSNNTPGIPNDIFFCFNAGGALGDRSWLQANMPPMVCFHVPNDPFAPYADGPVIVPVTGDFVVDVSGSYSVVSRADSLGNNSSFYPNTWTDAFTLAANLNNGGFDGLMPFPLPDPPGPATGQASPWDWVDSTTTYQICIGLLGFTQGHTDTIWYNTLATNPNMSSAWGNTYIDSIMGYLNPRIWAHILVGVNEPMIAGTELSVFPNPATDQFTVSASSSEIKMNRIDIFDMNGKKTMTFDNIKSNSFTITRRNLASGIYFIKITTPSGVALKKISLQ